MKFDWTAEAIDRLLALHAKGMTAFQISRELGVTRNAVIGKLHRLRLKGSVTVKSAAPKGTKVTVHKPKPKTKPKISNKPVGFIMPLSQQIVPAPDLSQCASIVDVTGCRWPVKDDPAFIGGVAFCNHPQADHSSYCAQHAAEGGAPYSKALIRKTLGLALYVIKRAA